MNIFEEIKVRLNSVINACTAELFTGALEKEKLKIKIDTYSKVIDIINQIEKEYGNGWIPVSSGKLPDNGTWCIATFESGIVNKIQYTERWGWNGELPNNKVIAWQRLPQPYKEYEV